MMIQLLRSLARLFMPAPECNATIVCSLNLVTEAAGPYGRLHAVAQEIRESRRHEYAAGAGWRTAVGRCVAFPESGLEC